MPMANQADNVVAERVNDLYWHSERTVTDLLAELDLSRNALYNALQPLSTGHGCPDCDSTLVYTNRSNRSSSRASCPDCGRVMQLAAEAAEAPPKATSGKKAAGSTKAASSGRSGGSATPATSPRPTREDTGARSQRVTPPRYEGHDVTPAGSAPPRGVVFGAVALGGLALGALVAFAARRLT
jgi:hypothetical protein